MKHRTHRMTLVAVAVLLSGVAPDSIVAQIRGSEHAIVAQTVDGTTITVEYSRPAARGRTLFGDLVPFDAPWTGANWATTVDVDKDVRVNGEEVPAGKYSVWITPREGNWGVFLDPNDRLFHFQKPDSTSEQIHLVVAPQQGPHVETLTWSFPAVTGDATRLQMHWGETTIPLEIVVEPTKPVLLADDERAIYLGTYNMQMLEGLGWPTTSELNVFEEDGLLRGRLPFPIHPGDELVFDLVPAGTNRFSPGLYRDGTLFNVEMGGTFEFDVADDRATTVRLRGIEGTVFGDGTRAAEGSEL